MTKEEFLQHPERHLILGKEWIPVDWIAAAWNTVHPFRESITYAFIRSVRKDGDLNEVASWPTLLNQFITVQQAVELYVAIRDRSGRYEDEWRPYFAKAFPCCVAALPTAAIVDELERARLVEWAKAESLRQFGPPSDSQPNDEIPF